MKYGPGSPYEHEGVTENIFSEEQLYALSVEFPQG